MERPEDLRAADADREAVAERLREAVDEGRLDLYEYDERLQRAYAAKTYRELDTLLTDLPRKAPVEPVAPSPSPPPRRPVLRPWLVAEWSGWAKVVTICVAIWLFTVVANAEFVYFWPVWVAGPWGAILLFRTGRGLAAGEPRRWAEQRQRRRSGRGGAGPPAVAAAGAPAAAGPAGAGPAAAVPAAAPVPAHRPVPRRGCC